MTISEITVSDVYKFLRLDDGEDPFLVDVLNGAKEFVCGYTGLTLPELDTKADVPLAVLVLCQDMYDRRTMHVDKGSINWTVKSILERHRVNLV
jgi:hypothetical protein